MRFSVFAMLTCASLMAALPSCNKTNNVSTSNETNNIYSKKIDERGGTVGKNGGLSVFIPGGAVDDEVLITIREADDDEYPTPPQNVAGPVYVIEPQGLELAAKATVHLPFPEGYVRPSNGSHSLAPIRPSGSSWGQIEGGLDPEASTATFDAFTFSFFALESVGIGAGPGAAGGPGSAGGASMPSSGGTSGVGGAGAGATGPGGSGPGGGEFCTPDMSAPEGSTNVGGELETGPFMGRDGFAAVMVEGNQKILLLTFTEHIAACGSALAAGTALSPKPVPGAQEGFSLALSAHLHFPTTEIEPGVYPRQAEPDMIEIMTYELGSMCDEKPMSVPYTVSLTIDTIDADTVTGSIEVLEYPGGPMVANGTFDVPFCDLPEAPGARCCVRP